MSPLFLDKKATGVFFIAIAAFLWATDALFRAPTVQTIDPVIIVLFEHVIGVLVLLSWIVLRGQTGQLRGYSIKTWLSLIGVGAGGSAMATLLFTASFKYLNPSVTILLQKLQPLFVIFLASIFLGERPSKSFWPWALIAILAATSLTLSHVQNLNSLEFPSKGVIYALAAAAVWACATVMGKAASHSLTPTILTFWRYSFGLCALVILGLSRKFTASDLSFSPPVLHALLYIAFVPGILSLIFYYSGLKRTPATTATFAELFFPVSSVALNWFFLGAALTPLQIGSSVLLLIAVVQIGRAT